MQKFTPQLMRLRTSDGSVSVLKVRRYATTPAGRDQLRAENCGAALARSLWVSVTARSVWMLHWQVASGEKLPISKLDSGDVFLYDTGFRVWLWVGKEASQQEKVSAFPFAQKYLKQYKRCARVWMGLVYS